MYRASDGDIYESEEDYQDSLKLEYNYHFSIPFEYDVINRDDGSTGWATAVMEVDFVWRDDAHGYIASFYVPDAASIDLAHANESFADIFEHRVYDDAVELMCDEGIPFMAIAAG